MSKSFTYIGGVVLLLALVGIFVWFVYQSTTPTQKNILEGIGMVVPGGGPYIVLQNPDNSTFTVSAERDEQNPTGRTVVLDTANAVMSGDDVLVVPFLVSNDPDVGSHLAYFMMTGGIPVFKDTAFVGETDSVPTLEARGTQALVARLGSSGAVLPLTKYFLVKENSIVESYALVNADIGTAFFTTPNPYEQVISGSVTIEGKVPRSWVSDATQSVRLVGFSGDEIARGDVRISDDPDSETLSIFSGLLSVPRSTLSAAYLSFESMAASDTALKGSITMPVVLGVTQ